MGAEPTSGALSEPRAESSSRSDSVTSAPCCSHAPTTSRDAPSASATRMLVARVVVAAGTPSASCARRRSASGTAGTPTPLQRPRQHLGDDRADPARRRATGAVRRDDDDRASVGSGDRQRQDERGRHAGSSIFAGGRTQACAPNVRWVRKPSSSYSRCARSFETVTLSVALARPCSRKECIAVAISAAPMP